MASIHGSLLCFNNSFSSPLFLHKTNSILRRNDRGSLCRNHRERSNLSSPNDQVQLTIRNKIINKSLNAISRDTSSISITDEILESYDDEYGGVIIDSDGLPPAHVFSSVLQSSFARWKSEDKKGIWLKLPEHKAELIPIAIKEGFAFHHAEPGYVMLTYWIPGGTCMLPATASHQVGVGAFVMNESREVLVVKEKFCPRRCSGLWKLPTGFVDKAEEIYSGAVREVKEETGVSYALIHISVSYVRIDIEHGNSKFWPPIRQWIDTVFLEIAAFRHAHLVAFEKSDLFFMCVLRPISSEIKIDEREIKDARWMPFDEFMGQSFYQEDSMLKKAIEVCLARYENRYRGFTAHRVISKFDDRLSYLYYLD